MRTLGTIRAALGGVALATVALAAVLSYSLARTRHAAARHHHRPHARCRRHRRPDAQGGAGRLGRGTTKTRSCVASTYNTLTESVAAAQRDAAQRERLSALGRLSTVIAHEIRNPLMIIKGALRQLSRPGAAPADTREAAADIDEEVDRLNRVVNEVLDFARPIRFDCAPAALNDVCRSAREAVVAAGAVPDIALELDPGCGELDDRRRARCARCS